MIDYDFDVICDQPNDSSDEYEEEVMEAYREELETYLPLFIFTITITDPDDFCDDFGYDGVDMVDLELLDGVSEKMMVDDTTAPDSSDTSENRIRRSPEDLLFEPIDPLVKEEKKEQPVRDADYAFDAGCYC